MKKIGIDKPVGNEIDEPAVQESEIELAGDAPVASGQSCDDVVEGYEVITNRAQDQAIQFVCTSHRWLPSLSRVPGVNQEPGVRQEMQVN